LLLTNQKMATFYSEEEFNLFMKKVNKEFNNLIEKSPTTEKQPVLLSIELYYSSSDDKAIVKKESE